MALKSNLHVLQNLAQLIILAMVTAIGCPLIDKSKLTLWQSDNDQWLLTGTHNTVTLYVIHGLIRQCMSRGV